MESALSKTILALDNMDLQEIRTLLKSLNGEVPTIKIGLELFLKHGPTIVYDLHNTFHLDIFLDLKLHDIPNTVRKSIRSLGGLPIKFLTIHLGGGEQMIREALLEAKDSLPHTSLLGVTFLTSLSEEDLKALYGIKNKDDGFLRLNELAIKCGIHGIILSPQELSLASSLEKSKGTKILKITPGIRFKNEIDSGGTQDQKRVMTPDEALQRGADYLVIGRSITSKETREKNINELKLIQK